MYFQAQKHWEVDLGFVEQVFGEPERSRFPLIEVGFNINIIVLDALFADDADFGLWSRFMFIHPEILVQFLDESPVSDHRVSLLARRSENQGEYRVSDVKEICYAKDSAKNCSYIFDCFDGNKYIHSPLTESEHELSDIKSIFLDSRESLEK